jgi:hypothetical protein
LDRLAKLLFLYRDALTWARSFSRAFGPSDDELRQRLTIPGFRYLVPGVDAYLKTHGDSIAWIEYLAHMWVSTMRDARNLKDRGASLACARFEDLKSTPQPVIQSLLIHCGLPMPEPDQLAEILAKDSQAGTTAARDKKDPARNLTDAELAELERMIRQLDPALTPDTIFK